LLLEGNTRPETVPRGGEEGLEISALTRPDDPAAGAELKARALTDVALTVAEHQTRTPASLSGS